MALTSVIANIGPWVDAAGEQPYVAVAGVVGLLGIGYAGNLIGWYRRGSDNQRRDNELEILKNANNALEAEYQESNTLQLKAKDDVITTLNGVKMQLDSRIKTLEGELGVERQARRQEQEQYQAELVENRKFYEGELDAQRTRHLTEIRDERDRTAEIIRKFDGIDKLLAMQEMVEGYLQKYEQWYGEERTKFDDKRETRRKELIAEVDVEAKKSGYYIEGNASPFSRYSLALQNARNRAELEVPLNELTPEPVMPRQIRALIDELQVGTPA